MGRTPVAWRNMTHRPLALAGALAATAFAVLIMFMELGFLMGLFDSQTALLRRLNGDLVVVSAVRKNLVVDETFPRARLAQAERVPGVGTAEPVYIEFGLSLVTNPQDRVQNPVRVIAWDMRDDPLDIPELGEHRDELRLLGTALYDRASRRFVGSFARSSETEIGSRRFEIVGAFALGADYYYDGNVVMGAESFFATFPGRSREDVALGVLRLEQGADASEVGDALRAQLPADVDVLTRDDLVAREIDHWRRTTPVGYVFSLGLVVGFVIGVAICYQILFDEVNAQLSQFAMLRAIGYEDAFVSRIVLQQSVFLGGLGYAIGLLLTGGLYRGLTHVTGITTELTAARAVLVLVLTLAMSVVAGHLAKRRALTADPAELY